MEYTFTVKVEAASEMEALHLMLDLKRIADDMGHEMVWFTK
jgi:hypothetical protein